MSNTSTFGNPCVVKALNVLLSPFVEVVVWCLVYQTTPDVPPINCAGIKDLKFTSVTDVRRKLFLYVIGPVGFSSFGVPKLVLGLKS